jgi:flagellar export protein FliJ
MIMGKRFVYPLEPLRLTREWALDAARQALARQNAVLAEAGQAMDQARQQESLAQQQARALGAGGGALPVQQFLQHGRYLDWLGQAAQAAARKLDQAGQERDALAVQLATAQRALDGVERHRKQARQYFQRARAQEEARQADDLWGVLQAGRSGHGN